MAKGRKTGGKTTGYRREIVDQILEALRNGSTVTRECRARSIPPGNFFLWVEENRDGLAERFACAKRTQIAVWTEESMDIADDGTNDFTEVKDRQGNVVFERFNNEHFQRSKLRIGQRNYERERYAAAQAAKAGGALALAADAILTLLAGFEGHKATTADHGSLAR